MRPTDRKADPVREQAARWFARSRDGLDAACRAELDAWLREDPRHAYEFQALHAIWQAATQVPADRLRALAEPPARRPVSARRAVLTAGACALALGLGAVVWGCCRARTSSTTARPPASAGRSGCPMARLPCLTAAAICA
ncbi:fecR-like transmembrane sensor domain protein [Bordetella holmesii 41130]|nr:fecR-like transmembrane sensor domain protein [Bordetella holmesii 41130]